MTRLIDADALKKSLDEHVYLVHHGFNETEYGCTQYGIHQIIDDAPTIEAQPVRHGKWIRQTDTRFGEMLNDILICSECNIAFSTLSMIRRSYCPNCGARMDEE